MSITNQELEEKLLTLPSFIARKAEEAEDARVEYEQTKAAYDFEKAKELLNQKAQNSKLTQRQLEALVERAVSLLWLDVILAESKWRRLMIEVEKFANEFAGIRKLIELRKHELISIGGVN